jgi:hypothetical protein
VQTEFDLRRNFMIRKKIGVFSMYALVALLTALFIAISVFAQTIVDMKEGRIADGVDINWGGGAICALAAGTVPVIDKLSLEGASGDVKAGGSFKVAVELKDFDKSITGSGVVFKNKDTGATISAGGDNVALADGKYINVAVSENAKGGVYVIERLVLQDEDLNTHIFYNSDLYNANYSASSKTALSENQKLSVTVVSSNMDTAPPTLTAYEIEKSDVAAGEEIIFAVEAEDEAQTSKDVYNNDVTYSASGLNSLKVTWQRQPEEGETGTILGKYTFTTKVSFADLKKNGNVYQGTFKVPSVLVAGEYVVKNIELDDKSGNSTVYVNPDVDIWEDLFGGEDTRNHLSDEICSLYMDITGTKTGDGAETKTTSAAKKGSSTKTGSAEQTDNTDSTTKAGISATKSVINSAPSIESFTVNSFGKMAAYLTLKGAEDAELGDSLDDDTKAYASQSFRFSVVADLLAIEDNSSLSVGRVLDGDVYDNARLIVRNRASRSVVFDIDLLDESGISVQPDGIVSISTDLPEDFNADNVSVYRISEDGNSCTKLDSTINGSRISFDTDHFSIFVIAQDADGTVSTAASPRTADEAPLEALGFVLAAAFMAFAVNAGKMRKQGM